MSLGGRCTDENLDLPAYLNRYVSVARHRQPDANVHARQYVKPAA